MDPGPHLRFCACKTATLGTDLKVFMGPTLQMRICVLKTARLAPELHVSMTPRPQLWICAHKIVLSTRTTSLYW